MIDIPADQVCDLPCVLQASYLHVNQKSDDDNGVDDDDDDKGKQITIKILRPL